MFQESRFKVLALAGQIDEHLSVAGITLQQGNDALDGLDRLVTSQTSAEHVDLVELEGLQQKFLTAGRT